MTNWQVIYADTLYQILLLQIQMKLIERLKSFSESLSASSSLLEDREDILTNMGLHPQFRQIYFAAQEASSDCRFWLRTFTDPIDKRGIVTTYDSLQDLYLQLMDPTFQDQLAGTRFIVTVLDGKHIVDAFSFIMATQ